MKLNEIIELNGKEYKVELNRDSAVKIEQYVSIDKISEKLQETPYEDKTQKEIEDGENPFADSVELDDMLNLAEEQENMLENAYCRAFWIWLYPCEKLDYSKVESLIKEDIKDANKAKYLTDKFVEFINKSVEVRTKYLEEQKNLKALAK